MKKFFALLMICCILPMNLTAIASTETESESETDYNPYLVLVNKTHELPNGWGNVIHIDTAINSLGEENRIERKTYQAFRALRSELLSTGVQIELDSVYRSVEEQQEIWDEWSADPEKGEDYCKKYLAVPGYSEHHTGLAVDIFIMKDGKEIRDNDSMIADEEDFTVVHELLPKYGVILRYPKDQDEITGYAYEPWHLRYINDPALAQKITDESITLEEYLGAK